MANAAGNSTAGDDSTGCPYAQPEPQPEQPAQSPLISVTFNQAGRLGLCFEAWPALSGTQAHSLASRHQELVPGLILIGVQGRNIEGLGAEAGTTLYQQAGRPVRLTFRAPSAAEEALRVAVHAEAKAAGTLVSGGPAAAAAAVHANDRGGAGSEPDKEVPRAVNQLWWTKDSDAPICAMESCGVKFSTRVRRHHCRCCGRCICKGCSTRKLALQRPADVTRGRDHVSYERACDACYMKHREVARH
jgi:hypothetical protein|eukprot:COSAG01_NODE_11681_length_1880_cov_8.459293_1_plen_246_part_00